MKMKLSRRQLLHFVAGAATFAAFPRIARAQGYPSRPITIVVASGAGTAMDVVTRILAQHMRVSLGQPIVIENVTGANGSIGAARVARAAPDGYTLIVGTWNNFVSNGALYPLRYDLVTDFEPISLLVNVPFFIVAKKTVPANNLQEFVAWLRAREDAAMVGSGGVGSSAHVGGLLLQSLTGARFRLVHYRGGGQALQDVVSERIDWTLSNPTDGLPLARSGNIKVYAVAAPSPKFSLVNVASA